MRSHASCMSSATMVAAATFLLCCLLELGLLTSRAAGQTIEVDPQTGALAAPAPSAGLTATSPELSAALRTSSADLVEQPNLVDGGVTVDLQGRFQSVVVATVRPDGAVGMSCSVEGEHDVHTK